MNRMKKNHLKKGFGILEVLLAGVIIVTMLGALVVLGRTVLMNIANNVARAQATYLAQEGIEIARQIRDTNYIDGTNTTGWNSFVRDGSGAPRTPARYGPTFYGSFFMVDYDSTDKPMLIAAPPSTDGEEITTADGNKFVRTISFDSSTDTMGIKPSGADSALASDSIVKVICKVTWGSGKSLSVEEFVANSRPNF